MEILVKSLEYFIAKFPYDQRIVDYIKSTIPAPYREYNNQTTEWKIHQYYFPQFIEHIRNLGIEYSLEVDEKIQPYFSKDDSILDYTSSKTPYYDHQKQAIKFEMTHQNFIIGDDQGLGKTLELLAFATSLKNKGVKHCLIICGVAGNVWNWQQEISIHTNEKSYILGTDIKGNIGGGKDKLESLYYPHEEFFYITNIETLRLLRRKEGRKYVYPIAEMINTMVKVGQISLIAVDECHKVKNPESQQGKALLKLVCPRKAMLSGTLVMNNPLDLYVPLCWMGIIPNNYYRFKQEFCQFGGFGGVDIVGYKNQSKLKQLLSPIYLRRKKEEVLDLPPKILTDEIIKLNEQQMIGYNTIQNGLQQNVSRIMFSENPLSTMLKLREFLDDPSIVEMNRIPSPKYERLKELLDNIFDNDESQVIIYSQWSRITRTVRDIMKQIYKNVSYIDGEVPQEERMSEMNKFQCGTNKIIIGTIGAMGTGFTLNKATDVIFIDEPWNMAIKNQAIDRAHRIGTKYPVNVHTLICKHTIDERIHDLIRRKGEVAEDLLSTDNPKLTNEDIRYLIGLE